MNKYAFVVTSAINTKFGVYNSEQRLSQTIDTIHSIKQKAPGSKIYLLELAGVPLTTEQKSTLIDQCDHMIDFTDDPRVTGLYHSTDNWDVVKNVTEVMCFQHALSMLSDAGKFEGVQRIFKMSGRYVLTDDFDISFYDQYSNQSFIVIGKDKPSQFPYELTLVPRQFMARLWSWPTILNDEIIKAYQDSLVYMYQRLHSGGYADIEHVLYKFLDHNKIMQKETLGVKGNIAPNGVAISN